MDEDETGDRWEPLDPTDEIFDMGKGKSVAYFGQQGENIFGALVELQADQWVKKVSPLEVLPPLGLLHQYDHMSGQEFMEKAA